MNFIYYLICFVVGYIISTFSLSTILLTLTCTFPTTLKLYKENAINLDDKTRVIKMASTTIFIHMIVLLVVIALICHFALSYISGFLFGLILSMLFTKFGQTEDNMSDYLKIYFPNTYDERSNIINELVTQTGLSMQICTDCYDILILAKSQQKDYAIEMIYDTLIPHLKQEEIIGNVGIALGLLINDYLLTKEEANELSMKTINEMVSNGQIS